MNHLGAPDNPTHETAPNKPMRQFDLETAPYGRDAMHDTELVDAHVFRINGGYTEFWITRPEDEPDFLVLAVRSDTVVRMTELPQTPKHTHEPAWDDGETTPDPKPVKRDAALNADLLTLDSGDL